MVAIKNFKIIAIGLSRVYYVALAILAVCHSWLPIKCVAKSACGTIDFASFS